MLQLHFLLLYLVLQFFLHSVCLTLLIVIVYLLHRAGSIAEYADFFRLGLRNRDSRVIGADTNLRVLVLRLESFVH